MPVHDTQFTGCYCTVSNPGFPFRICLTALENKIRNGKHNSTFWEEYPNSFKKEGIQVQQKATIWPSYILLLTYSTLCCLQFKAVFVWNDLLPHLPTARLWVPQFVMALPIPSTMPYLLWLRERVTPLPLFVPALQTWWESGCLICLIGKTM